jgi:hypothetical protein
MINQDNLLALRNAIDATLGDIKPSPGKHQSKKRLLMKKFAEDHAAGKWKQTTKSEKLMQSFSEDHYSGKWKQKARKS